MDIQQNNFTKYLKTDNMENTNLSEEAIKLKELEDEIDYMEYHKIPALESGLFLEKQKLEKLKERKKSLLNYLNTDNN